MSNLNVAVIGAGIVGLSTALAFQQEHHNTNITVLADKFFSETTSDVAAGYYVPDEARSRHKGQQLQSSDQYVLDYEQWSKVSGEKYRSMAVTEEGFAAGVGISPFYELMTENPEENPGYAPHMFTFSRLKTSELDWLFPTARKNFNVKCGFQSITCYIENQYYLPYMMTKLENNGNFKALTNKVTNIADLFNEYDVVFNCSGLGARQLVNDDDVFPIRGQIIRAKAPWMTYSVYAPHSTYAFINRHEVILGGVYDSGNYSLEIDQLANHEIMRKLEILVPSLKFAKQVQVKTGLRPGRKTGVRVEMEDKRSILVHNYGHGAEGVGLSWGTAVHAAKLAKDGLRMTKISSKL